jgi:hypothetical protein
MEDYLCWYAYGELFVRNESMVERMVGSTFSAHVEALICEAYIIEEISTFISYYFEPHLRMRINRVSRHDDGGEVSSSGNLSIFSNLGRPTPKNTIRGRYLSEIEFRQEHNYVLFNCDGLKPFIQ